MAQVIVTYETHAPADHDHTADTIALLRQGTVPFWVTVVDVASVSEIGN